MLIAEYKFKDLLLKIVDNRGKTCPTSDSGTALIATNCVSNHELYPVFEKVRWVDDLTMQSWFRGHPKPGDVIFVTKGSPGRCCLTPDPVNFCIAQDMVAIRANEEVIDSSLLLPLLRSSSTQNAIANLHVGSLIPHFKKGDFDKLKLRFPSDKKIQKAVGNIYLMFSDKIALNRKLNATLEAMAQALFQSWFVDFDPVKAKLAAVRCGRDPEQAAMAAIACKLVVPPGKPKAETLDAQLPSAEAIDAAIAALDELSEAQRQSLKEKAAHFPAEFQESELGLIPQGWENVALYNTAEFVNGSSFKSSDFSSRENALPIIKIVELKQGISAQTKYTEKELRRNIE